MTVLGKRILTALVLLPPLVAVVLYGKGRPFFLVVGGVAALCAGEYFRLFFPAGRDRWAGVAATVLVYACGALLPLRAAGAGMLCCVALAAFPFLSGGETPGERTRRAADAALGAIYIGGFLSSYPRTAALHAGEHWVLLGLVSVFAGDTFAYFIGRAFGRTPLAPVISPNKTVEGSLGGLAASAALGAGYGALFLPGVPGWLLFLASAAVGTAGQAGDLFESLLKRAAGAKDSGALLPGHGGMFDRVDAAVCAGPVLYLIALFVPVAGGGG